jgi:hypothetical protein
MNQQQVQAQWNRAAIYHFIRRMLLYYDPWELTVMMAPDDEYDAYIPKVFHLAEEKLDQKFLEGGLYNLFKNGSAGEKRLRRKARRMAEDLIDLSSKRE